MGITPVATIASKPSAAPAASVAPVPPASGTAAKASAAMAVAPVPEKAPPPPPPPPPAKGFDFDVVIGEHEPSGHRVYDFVDPDSGESVVQIPIDAVLDLVAEVLRKLEAEGLR